MNREDLVKQALEVVSPDLYYDLVDCIDSVSDEDLLKIIECDGDYKKELLLA